MTDDLVCRRGLGGQLQAIFGGAVREGRWWSREAGRSTSRGCGSRARIGGLHKATSRLVRGGALRLMLARWGRANGSLAALAAAQAAETSCLVEAGLLPLGAEVPPVPHLAQYTGALHRSLEPLEKALAVLSVAKRHMRQITLLLR